ncbi:MAG: DUF4157 domain-containing protein [Cytophagia bacterium]|nr:DUF4157 domain-containing protein [Cytophagia bacterium]
MNTHADKTLENKSRAVANSLPKQKSNGESTFQFVDNKPEAVAQRKLQEMANNSPKAMQLKAFQEMANNSRQAKQAAQLQAMADNYSARQQQPIQKKENNTGLPDNLKSGIENLSGYSMDDVKVHYNSEKPAQLEAHAYAKGTDIHIASGQEKHLPHEAWHVVQQKQGRVKPTFQMKGVVNVNDDVRLEKEADVMGAKAFTTNTTTMSPVSFTKRVKGTFQLMFRYTSGKSAPKSNLFGFNVAGWTQWAANFPIPNLVHLPWQHWAINTPVTQQQKLLSYIEKIPQYKGVKVDLGFTEDENLGQQGLEGNYDPSTTEITLAKNLPNDKADFLLLEETLHKIQHKSGMDLVAPVDSDSDDTALEKFKTMIKCEFEAKIVRADLAEKKISNKEKVNEEDKKMLELLESKPEDWIKIIVNKYTQASRIIRYTSTTLGTPRKRHNYREIAVDIGKEVIETWKPQK